MSIATGGILSYPSAGKVSFSDGTIELWIAPTKSGTDPVYSQYAHTLFRYAAVNGDALIVSEASGGGLIAGTLVGGKFTGWGFPLGQMSPWKAGDWHHVAFTYSVAQGRIRLYLDGTLGFGNDTSSIPMPGSNGASFTIDSDPSGHASAFLVDELRISSDEKSAAQIHYDATRSTPFADNEVMLPLVGISPGSLNYSVGGCGSATYNYVGVPITNLTPAEGLLSAGSTSVRIAFNTVQSTTCRYSLGSADDYASMLTLDTGPPSAAHQGVLNGLSSDPRVVNRVYLRCASNPDYLRTLTYRTVAPPGQAFPRIGTIWTGWYLYQNASDLAKKNQLFLSTSPLTPLDITQLRAANPGFLGITEVNVSVFDAGFSPPEDYYLKDIHGNKIISWCAPALYLANTTKPEVAQALARQAYQQLVDSNFVYDGLFFDSFNTTISQPFTDCHGNAVEIDSNGDGIADDPAILNAAWKAGMYSVINAFRSLAPNAYVSGHVLATPAQPESLAAFNGTSLLGSTETVKEGLIPFGDLWDLYQTWESQGVWPTMTMIQSCPPNLLSYGYGYQPLNQNHMLPSTMAFAQSSYPNMRFGLGLSLMGDGFFGFDTGDSASQIAWWYDEYDFNLGYPLGPAVQTGAGSSANLMANGGFEAGLSQWQLTVANGKATLAVDTSIAAEGSASAHINVVSAGAANSVRLVQDKAAWSAGVEYRIQFWARADAPRTITVSSVGSGPKSAAPIAIGTSWGFYSLSFTALTTPQIGRLEFWVGDIAGNIWIDDVRLVQEPSLVYRRDFTNGVVLLNGSATPQTVTLEAGLRRFKGTQAPLYQYMLDDADGAFSATGSWKTVTYNTGSWGPAKKNLPPAPQNQNGPYYHCWEGTCHQLDSGASPAQWNLNTPADGQYTIQAWLPAAPGAASWTKSAVYEVVAGGHVVASATIDQSTASAGDALHAIATVNLTAADAPFLRVHNEGTGALIADAVYVTSAALYNDGSSAPQVTLGGFDSILLQRQQPLPATTSRVNSVVHAATFQPSISSGGFVAISGTGFGSSPRTWASSDFSGTSLPSSLGGVSATINGKPAYVEYISPTQINVIAPDDDTVGQVQVQVTTPQGANYTGTVLKQKLSPGLFTYQAGTTNYAAAVHPDGTFVGPTGPSSRPAAPGEVIAIYGTGFGATTPAAPSAQLVSQAAPTVLPVTIMIGGVTAEVQWAGLVSSGLYQINVKIPELAAGDRPIQATIGGFQSPPTVMLPSASP
ncbi:MAG TPA: LamG-like jellyroll fold domain-containing protein [Bryobacteraceae bacterium]